MIYLLKFYMVGAQVIRNLKANIKNKYLFITRFSQAIYYLLNGNDYIYYAICIYIFILRMLLQQIYYF